MKILLVSDSHGDDESLRKIASKHNDCDCYVHLGDSQSNDESIRPFIAVKGNCDFYSSKFPKFLELNSPYGKIYCEHIPFYQTSIPTLKRHNFKIYLCGHTHIKKNEMVDGVRVINPGAIAYPRDSWASYAIVTITENSVKCQFYDLSEI
ncbi:MAG: YfcE family phosphodiesterase [Bacilli bacterium]|nr:YfcE family phosphodiesterase [Bacilli bacterium]